MAGEQVRVTETWTGFTRQVGELLDAGVVAVDPSLIVIAWNPWMERVTGMRAADVVGRPLEQIDPHLRANTRAAFERALGGATVVLSHQLHGYVIDVKPPAGHEDFPRMQQSARIVPLYDEAGIVLSAVAIIYDVTERVARERDLRAALEAAQSADRAKSDFLAAMSHELRTPIGAMSGYADLLSGEILGSVNDVQRQHLGRIKSVAAHLLGIVDEILTFARMQADRERVHVAELDAVAVCGEAIVAVEPLAERKKLRMVRRLPDAPIPMRSDGVKIRQVLINLLGNAVKFTSDGTITLEVARTADGAHVEFRVSDTGVGIAPDDLPRVFEPFVQVRRDRQGSAGGTGLGLAVSRQLAQMLGGDLTATSEVGVGTTFVATVVADARER
jgi:PAS domain S-box-containing protein